MADDRDRSRLYRHQGPNNPGEQRRHSSPGERSRDRVRDVDDAAVRGGSDRDRLFARSPYDDDDEIRRENEQFERDHPHSHGPADYPGSSDYNWPLGGGYGGSRYGMRGRGDYGRWDRRGGDENPREYGRRGYGDDFGWSDYSRRERGQSGERYRDTERGLMDRASDEISSWFGDEDAAKRRQEDHRGKGPRGYRRSDSRIEEDVNDRLSDDPAVDATDIAVTVADGEVTLSGEVDSKYAKRQAEDCADSVSGVLHVQNNLRVRRPGTNSASTVGGGESTSG
jgi:osmotically-inducible protein OsmY